MERRKRLERGERLFKRFNGRHPKHLDTVRVPDYKQLVRIGPCVAIAYRADDVERAFNISCALRNGMQLRKSF